jgi:hypothetical protein
MKTRFLLFLVRFIPFFSLLIATGLFVYVALQNGQAIYWVGAGLNGLGAVVLLCWTVITMRQKPPAT